MKTIIQQFFAPQNGINALKRNHLGIISWLFIPTLFFTPAMLDEITEFVSALSATEFISFAYDFSSIVAFIQFIWVSKYRTSSSTHFDGRRQALNWLFAFVVLVSFCIMINVLLPDFINWELEEYMIDMMFGINMLGLLALSMGGIIFVFMRIRNTKGTKGFNMKQSFIFTYVPNVVLLYFRLT